MALLAQKLWKILFCQNPFPAILRREKKVPMATKPKMKNIIYDSRF